MKIPSVEEQKKLPSDGGDSFNRLVFEQSPYLLQHATNPVDWFPWSDEAFEKAKKENKPVFLSIGYATCHWCHVMERESFEDDEVASLLNNDFIAIKVDREERPDIDQIYMTACQMMTGSGGWPLTCFLTPDGDVFYAATYFPKHGIYGRPGMMELLPGIAHTYKSKHGEVLRSAGEIRANLEAEGSHGSAVMPEESTALQAFGMFKDNFDETHGGFGDAPKFPVPHQLFFLLRYHKRTGDSEALRMAEKTLQAMAMGGIYDHVGFGFHRYSTDREWVLPHFEKMLYDQALLLQAFSEAAAETGSSFFKSKSEEIIEYLKYRLEHAEGGFYSAEDADSEGVEGKFYLWHFDELQELLENKDLQWFTKAFNVSEKGNFTDEATGRMTGANILHLTHALYGDGSQKKEAEKSHRNQWKKIREKLFLSREQRVHPLLDDKILTDWNGLMIASLAGASQLLENHEALQMSEKAFAFICKNLMDPKGELMKRYRSGKAGLPAHLDDYAFMIRGALELHQATLNLEYLLQALKWTKIVHDKFSDPRGGGFFFTESGTKLAVRRKEAYDGALPSGNGVMAYNLAHLYHLTGDISFKKSFEALAAFFGGPISRHPTGYSYFLSALEIMMGPVVNLVFSGIPSGTDVLQPLRGKYLPFTICLGIEKGKEDECGDIAPFTRNLKDDETLHCCHDFSCELPVRGIQNIKKRLNELSVE